MTRTAWIAIGIGLASVAGCESAGDDGAGTAYGVDTYGHVETAPGSRGRRLPLEPERGTPWQEYRVLMTGAQRVAFDAICDALNRGLPIEGEGRIIDPRERFLIEHGIRLKYELLRAGLEPGMPMADADALVTKVTGAPPVERHSLAEPRPGVGPQGGVDYSHDLIERALFRSFNGFGTATAFLSHRNGVLEWWEVQAESRG